jgi:6-phosphogluconolactonase
MISRNNFLQILLLVIGAVTLVNCAPAVPCNFASAARLRRDATTNICTGGGTPTCSSTLKPVQVMLSTDSKGNLLEFGLDPTSGVLTLMCNTGTAAPGPIVVTPNNLFVYVLDATAGNQIFGFTIAHANSGALTAITGSPFKLTGTVTGETIAVDPMNRFVYVTDHGNSAVHVLSIAQSGALAEVTGSPFTVSSPDGIALTASGNIAYVPDSTDGDIFIFAVDAFGGLTMNPLSNSPFIIASVNDRPHFALVHPQANFLFTANAESVSSFAIDPTNAGALTQVGGSPFQTGGQQVGPLALALDKSLAFLYVIPAGVVGNPGFQSENIIGYHVDTTGGGLTLIPNSPFTSTSTTDLIANPLLAQMYLQSSTTTGTTTTTSIQIEALDANGNLTASGTPLTVTTTTGVGVLAIANIQ